MKKEDIVIIGGGVGGLEVAKTLAEDEISPLLLERNKEFGQKACGEMVAEEFSDFTIYDFLRDENIILRNSDRMAISFLGKEYFFNLKNSKIGFKSVLQIDKKLFEENLAREAEKSGARIFLGRAVKKLERKGNSILVDDEIEAKILIGADGFHSIVRKFVGQKFKNFGFAISGYGESKIEYPLFIFDPEVSPKGYGWIFPGKGKKSNIGFGSLEIKEVKTGLEKFLRKFNLKIENQKGAILPSQLPSKTYFDNILLVGDAASLTDPLSGGGIANALISGYLAAKIAKEAILKNETSADFLKKYEKEWRRRIYNHLVRNYFFQKIFSHFLSHQKSFTSLILKFLSKIS